MAAGHTVSALLVRLGGYAVTVVGRAATSDRLRRLVVVDVRQELA